MLRSIFARPHPLLFHLRRHDRRSVAQLGRRADEVQARGYSYTSEDETDSDVDRPEAKDRRPHLYVVLEDWKKGFSIHKLDLDDGSEGGDLTQRPPVHRQLTGDRFWNFGAVGGKIIAAGRVKSKEEDHVTLVYDTEMAGLSIVPGLPAALRHGWVLAAAAGNGLYTFDKYHGRMHLLEDAPVPADDKHGSEAFWWGTADHWSWSSIPTPLPFNACFVESIAVHPDGTLFVSVGKWDSVVDIDGNMIAGDDWDPLVNREITDDGLLRTSETFSYNTGTGEWRRHGDWHLPFYGQAHYDAELEAWVGLRKVHEPDHLWTDSYLCSSDVASPDGSPVQPDCKLCAEGLFDPHMNRTDASLLHMGGSNYCFVEIASCDRFRSNRCEDVGLKSVIRVATFRLRYGKKGELILTARRPNPSYHFSSFYEVSTCSSSKLHAFWM